MLFQVGVVLGSGRAMSEGFVETICLRVNSCTLEDLGIGGGGICHHLSTWRNCSTMRTAAYATSSGVVSPTTPASSTTHVSAKALVAFPL